MSAVAEPMRLDAETEADLLFGADPPAADALDQEALKRPIYVGAVDAHQRGVFGPVSLEIMIEPGWIELGPFILPAREAKRLLRLLTVAVAATDPTVLRAPASVARPAPWPESGRGIAGWDLDLARNPTGLAAAGCPREGETLP